MPVHFCANSSSHNTIASLKRVMSSEDVLAKPPVDLL